MAKRNEKSLRCPACKAVMEEGVMPSEAGLRWLRRTRTGTTDFAESIPNTMAILRPNRLVAWRCKACELVLFHYGKPMLDDDDQPPPTFDRNVFGEEQDDDKLARD